ncbi:MAG: hypothetical protein CL916_13825 [Deltaproteobacteria bacterium]|nr:hypothetical protein [Deltaproteobacteria bacterium]
MEQDNLSLFSIIFSLSLVVFSTVGILLFVSQLYIPAWQILLGMSNPWYCSILILFLCPILGMMKLPLSFRFQNHSGTANLLGILGPSLALIYSYPDVSIHWSPVHFIPALLSFVLYWISSHPSPNGGTLYRICLLIGSISTILFLNSILGRDIRSFLWLAFASQFIPLLIIDFIRTSQSARYLSEGDEFIIGGTNAHSHLWIGPSSTIMLAYCAHLLFWEFKNPLFG